MSRRYWRAAGPSMRNGWIANRVPDARVRSPAGGRSASAGGAGGGAIWAKAAGGAVGPSGNDADPVAHKTPALSTRISIPSAFSVAVTMAVSPS